MLEIKGLKELQKKMDELSRNLGNLHGNHSVQLSEILPPKFVSKYTDFANFDQLVKASGFKVNSKEDFEAIPDAEWDAYIRSISKFSNWKAMMSEAAGEWAKKKLKL